MRTHLTPHGDEFAIIIPDAILQELQFGEGSAVELTVDDGTLKITPLTKNLRREEFENALGKTNHRYGSALRRLADS